MLRLTLASTSVQNEREGGVRACGRLQGELSRRGRRRRSAHVHSRAPSASKGCRAFVRTSPRRCLSRQPQSPEAFDVDVRARKGVGVASMCPAAA